MSFSPLELLIGALAVWRLSALIAYERGPFGLFMRLRSAAGIEHFDDGTPDGDQSYSELGKLLLCVWCNSPWLAAAWVIGYVLAPQVTMIVSTVLALSAVAISLERWNNG